MHNLSNVLPTLLLITILLCVSVIDLRRGVIPDELNAILAMIGLLVSWLYLGRGILTILTGSTAVLLLSYGVAKTYHRIRGQDGLGLGDVKFLGAAACWIEVQYVPWLVLVASISGLSLVLLSRLIAAQSESETSIAFGPHLSLGLVVVWLSR